MNKTKTRDDLQSLRFCMVYSGDHEAIVAFMEHNDPRDVCVKARIGFETELFNRDDDFEYVHIMKRQTVLLTDHGFLDTEWDCDPRANGRAKIVSIALGDRMLRLMDHLYATSKLREL